MEAKDHLTLEGCLEMAWMNSTMFKDCRDEKEVHNDILQLL